MVKGHLAYVCAIRTPGVGRTPGMFSIKGNIIGTVGAIMSTPGAFSTLGDIKSTSKGCHD